MNFNKDICRSVYDFAGQGNISAGQMKCHVHMYLMSKYDNSDTKNSPKKPCQVMMPNKYLTAR